MVKGEGCYPRRHHARSSAQEEHDLEGVEMLRLIVKCKHGLAIQYG